MCRFVPMRGDEKWKPSARPRRSNGPRRRELVFAWWSFNGRFPRFCLWSHSLEAQDVALRSYLAGDLLKAALPGVQGLGGAVCGQDPGPLCAVAGAGSQPLGNMCRLSRTCRSSCCGGEPRQVQPVQGAATLENTAFVEAGTLRHTLPTL